MPDTLRRLQEEWLRSVTYRPGVSLAVVDGALVIKVKTIDSRMPHDALEEVEVTHRTVLPRYDLRRPRHELRAEFLDLVRECVLAMERHEAYEWFRVNGRMVVDPHALDLMRPA